MYWRASATSRDVKGTKSYSECRVYPDSRRSILWCRGPARQGLHREPASAKTSTKATEQKQTGLVAQRFEQRTHNSLPRGRPPRIFNHLPTIAHMNLGPFFWVLGPPSQSVSPDGRSSKCELLPIRSRAWRVNAESGPVRRGRADGSWRIQSYDSAHEPGWQLGPLHRLKE